MLTHRNLFTSPLGMYRYISTRSFVCAALRITGHRLTPVESTSVFRYLIQYLYSNTAWTLLCICEKVKI